jgi:acyl-CoA synthetase (AMP-forming)/AMP-acid ligase II
MGDPSRGARPFRSSFPPEDHPGFRTGAWQHGVARTAAELVPLHPTILHAFAAAARADGETGIRLLADAEAAPDEHRAHRRLYHEARAIAGGLVAAGLRRGDPVLLVLPTSFELVAAFFAVQLAGGLPVPSYPPAAMARATQALERLRHVAESSGATLCVTDRRLRPLLGTLPVRAVVTVDALAGGDPAAIGEPRLGPRDPAFIQYTSGSTDRPRGVLLTHGAVTANVHAIGQAAKIRRTDSSVVWLPLYHDMGLVGGLLFAIYWRIPLTLMSPLAFLADPLRWPREIARARATLSPAPNFAYALAARRAAEAPPRALDLSSWRLALNGAEPVNPATIDEFCARFAPYGFRREAVLPVYGLAEATLAVAFPDPGEAPRVETLDRDALADGRAVRGSGPRAVAVVSVGKAVPGHRVAVVDEHGAGLPDDEVGHIVVQGPSVMRGYHGNAEATRAVLRGDTLWTGDLGFVAGGRLHVVGRTKDLIIVRGRNVFAEDVERVAAAVEGARPGGVVAFGVHDDEAATEVVVLVCETRLTGGPERAALVRHLAEAVGERCQVALDEVVLARPGTIPKTPSGKAQRGLCRSQYLAGELGRARGGRAELAKAFVRSGAGYLRQAARRLLRREPD